MSNGVERVFLLFVSSQRQRFFDRPAAHSPADPSSVLEMPAHSASKKDQTFLAADLMVSFCPRPACHHPVPQTSILSPHPFTTLANRHLPQSPLCGFVGFPTYMHKSSRHFIPGSQLSQLGSFLRASHVAPQTAHLKGRSSHIRRMVMFPGTWGRGVISEIESTFIYIKSGQDALQPSLIISISRRWECYMRYRP